jgi:hypothetical protein
MMWSFVRRGKNKNIKLTPHRYVRDGGRFHLAKTKEGPYIAVASEAEIIPHLRRGIGLRMSNKTEDYPPSLIIPRHINGWQ